MDAWDNYKTFLLKRKSTVKKQHAWIQFSQFRKWRYKYPWCRVVYFVPSLLRTVRITCQCDLRCDDVHKTGPVLLKRSSFCVCSCEGAEFVTSKKTWAVQPKLSFSARCLLASVGQSGFFAVVDVRQAFWNTMEGPTNWKKAWLVLLACLAGWARAKIDASSKNLANLAQLIPRQSCYYLSYNKASLLCSSLYTPVTFSLVLCCTEALYCMGLMETKRRCTWLDIQLVPQEYPS